VNILTITYPLNGLLMIGMPVALAFYLTHKFKLGWRLWWIGGFTFILSQALHIPFNLLILNPRLAELNDSGLPEPLLLLITALALGLSAGVFEEFSRYGMYRWWAKDARSWGRGLLAGAGHGGFEAILLGGLVLLGFLQLLAIRNANLATVVPIDQLELAKVQVAAYWSANWYDSLLGAVERAFTIVFHLSASVLVLQCFTRRQMRWLWLAIAWHTLVDAGAVLAISYIGPYLTEVLIGFFSIISLGIIFWLRQPEPVEPMEADLPPQPPPLNASALQPIEENEVSLEKSRYDSN
jgi:uncharacterized membrane protein YhfC